MAKLEEIKSPADLKKQSIKELEELAQDIRDQIVMVTSKNGGHLSPSLGVVELTIALHKVFDFSKDKIVWDVGHQSYAHKLLTGRLERFHTLRQENGISGFPRMTESRYDHFNTGHAGTSISAALGFASARDLKGESNDVVAFIGDGAMTAGLAFEGLNNAGAMKKDIIVILNDNEMSISPNVGALSAHMNNIISGELYNKMRKEIDIVLTMIPSVGKQMTDFSHRVEDAIKGVFVPGRVFEDFGFKYFGPLDGHNMELMIDTIGSVRKLKGPRLIHVVTKKGKGYKPAEENPGSFHGTGPYEIATGKKVPAKKTNYTSIFSKTIVELAGEDEKIVAVTAAMRDGTGLVAFAEKYPDRLFDAGIAEQHAVTFSAGLAAEGYKPVVAIYSTFLQRAYDQLVHDVCNMNLPVMFAIDRAGIVGDDGSTHQGVFDISYLKGIPNMTIMAPKDENELRHMLYTGLKLSGPSAVRYPRGEVIGVPLDQDYKELKVGQGELLAEGNDLLICAVGNRVCEALKAAEKLEEEGHSVAVINARFIKPLDSKLILKWALRCKRILTVEEGILAGGFGSGVFEELRKLGMDKVIGKSLGVPDAFIKHAPQKVSRKKCGIDADGIYKKSLELLEKPLGEDLLQETATPHTLQ